MKRDTAYAQSIGMGPHVTSGRVRAIPPVVPVMDLMTVIVTIALITRHGIVLSYVSVNHSGVEMIARCSKGYVTQSVINKADVMATLQVIVNCALRMPHGMTEVNDNVMTHGTEVTVQSIRENVIQSAKNAMVLMPVTATYE